MAFGKIFLARYDIEDNLERAIWLHRALSGRQSQRAIRFILPAREVSHVINGIIAGIRGFFAERKPGPLRTVQIILT